MNASRSEPFFSHGVGCTGVLNGSGLVVPPGQLGGMMDPSMMQNMMGGMMGGMGGNNNSGGNTGGGSAGHHREAARDSFAKRATHNREVAW